MDDNPDQFHTALTNLENKESDERKTEAYQKYAEQFNKCEVCGKFVENNPEVHHILPTRFENDYIVDEDNLVALCSRCHHTVDRNRHMPRDKAPGRKEMDWRFDEFKKYTDDKRSRMMEKIVQDGKDRDLIKILMYEDQV